VTTFDAPAQKRAGARDIFRSLARATVRGMKVPRSPREPESSDAVRFRRCSAVRRRRRRRASRGEQER